MAYEFPRYLSKGKATTQQPSFLAPESTEGQVTEQYGKVGQTAQAGAFKMTEAYSEAQKTTAELNQRTGIDDLLQRAAADPDVNAYQKYAQENEKIRKESTSGFKNRLTAGEAFSKADYYARTTDSQLKGIFHKKMIDSQQANLLSLLDMDAQQGNLESISNRININKKKGFISETDAYKLEEKYKKQAKFNAFYADLNTDPENTRENLSNNAYGFSAEDLTKAKEFQRKADQRQKEIFKNTQMATVNDLGEKLANRTLNMEEVENAIAGGLIDAEMGTAFELAMAAPDRWTEFVGTGKDQLEPTLRADNFITPLEGLANSKNVGQRMKIIKSALQNRVDGKLEATDLNFILRIAAGKSRDPENKIWGLLNAAVNSSPSVVKSSAGIIEKFKSRWDFQEDPREVMKTAAIDQFKEDHPETAPYKIGDVVKRKSGSFEVVSFNEDGSPVFRKK